MGTTPEELKANIAQTREELTADVNALSDRVSPGKIAQRRTQAVRESVGGVRDRVMGAASSASDGATSAPTAVAERAQGNPLAAGLIAFGVGLLTSSLLPSTEPERQLATAVKDNVAEPVKDFASDQAQQAKEALQPEAQEALSELKDSAVDAAQKTAESAKSAGGDLADQARDAAHTVTG